MQVPGSPIRTTVNNRRPRDHRGFALIVTVSILVLLALVAVGMLTLSTVQIRTSRQGDAQAEARANARLALVIAIGEIQKTLGPDRRISAPAGILDPSPETESIDGLPHPHLTGVWRSRRDTLEDKPDYDRDASFQQWLVSHPKPGDVEDPDFVTSGSFDESVPMVNAPPSQTGESENQARAGLVGMKGGAYAWWVGDENCKARVNPRDLRDREGDQSVAELVAGLNTPGSHGIQALGEFKDFESNSTESDKIISLAGFELADGTGADPADYFHHLTPHSESLLVNVAAGGLRKDLSLFLEQTDLRWESPWGRAEGVRRRPSGPIGPNGEIALSPPNEYDVLGWKTLYHWYNMHRAISRRLDFSAMNGTTPVDPVTNPTWNSGTTLPTPVVARLQMLMSYGAKRSSTRGQYNLSLYAYPVLTLWNPYNISMIVPEYSVFLHTIPLEHRVYLNGRMVKEYKWAWNESGGATTGRTVLRLRQNTPLTLRPGEARILTYVTAQGGGFTAHDMEPEIHPYRPDHAGYERSLGSVQASARDRITIETKAARWETSGTSYGGQNFQTTFGYRCEPKNIHQGHPERFRQQMFCGQVCWRRERPNPGADVISETNFPSRQVGSVLDAPTPFLHLDVRLKTLDEPQLPNKLWSQCIPSHPFASATSTSKHARQGVDSHTTFFAHPYTVTFEQKTTPEGLFQSVAYIGTSNRPGGQTFITDREIPLAPLTSLAQLQNLPQYPMEGLNWSGYFFQNHAIGNSFANPGLASDEIKRTSFPFYLGEYFAWQGGDLTGQLYSNNTAFNVADYTIGFAPASIIDRSYAANHLLWDDYFFSSIASQDNILYLSLGGGKRRDIGTVIKQFFDGVSPLPNTVYRPHLGTGLTTADVMAELGVRRGSVGEDAHLKAASYLKVSGGFNVNSTSVPAWKAVLGAAHLKRVVIFDAPRGRQLQEEPPAKFLVTRFSLPNGPAAGNDANDEDLRWRGYRELTEEEIDELARAIVRQVKQRGPFRSLGEFVNRRLGPPSDDTTLYGALQAALEDEDVSINDNYRDLEITKADIARADYPFEEAALGSRYQGAPPYVTQADLLMNMGPVINARSDTFTVRAYGESRTPDGRTVRARAWCEVVVQRQPEYLDTGDEPETPFDKLGAEANKVFGRQLKVKAFRWLSESEINNRA